MTTIAENVVSRAGRAPTHSRTVNTLCVVILAGVCLFQIRLGAFPSRIYGHDLFVFLSGAWRVACGQIPCVDFYSGLGVLVWKPIQLAFLLHGFNAGAIGLARAFYTAVLGVWCLLLLRRGALPRWSICIWLFLVAFVSAARPLGEYPTWISHAMFYNRVGYALLFLIMIDQLAVSRFRAADPAPVVANRSGEGREYLPHGDFWVGFSTGAALACTLLLKISFTLVGMVFLCLGLLLFGIRRRHILGVVVGGAAVLATGMALLHFQPLAFFHETLILSRERHGLLQSQIAAATVDDLGGLIFTVAAGAAIAGVAFTGQRGLTRYVVATAVVVGCDVFCRATNAMRGDLPLSAFWCLNGAMFLLSAPALPRTAFRPRYLLALLLLCPLTIPLFVKDVVSSTYAALKSAATGSYTTLRFDSARLRSFLPLDWKGTDPKWIDENGSPLIVTTNDGLHLLNTLSRPQETVSTLAFVNPFSFALGRRPAEGGAVWLDPNNNVSTDHPLPVATLIGDPDLLMVEKPVDAQVVAIRAIFDAYPDLLSKDYTLVGSSHYWSLYRKAPAGH